MYLPIYKLKYIYFNLQMGKYVCYNRMIRGEMTLYPRTMSSTVDLVDQEDVPAFADTYDQYNTTYNDALYTAAKHWDEVLEKEQSSIRKAELRVARSKKTIEIARKRKAKDLEIVQKVYEKKYRESKAIVDDLEPFFGEKEKEERVPRHGLPVCLVCMDLPRDAVFSKCHHLVCCMTCAMKLEKRCAGLVGDHGPHKYYECPVCRAENGRITKIFF